MTPEAFRRAGHELIDWIADYRNHIEFRPVKCQLYPGEIKSAFPSVPPEVPADIYELLRVLEKVVVPGVTQVQHPMHYGWFPSNASLSSVLGDIASSGLGTLGISWESCPALTEVEEVMCDWMRQLVGLSGQWQGTIHDSASTACLTAMIIAREKASDFCQMQGGLQGLAQPLVLYATHEAHSSVQKAATLAGFGLENIRYVEVDQYTREMSPENLQILIEQDIKAGKVPALVVASSGTTGVTAFDPIKSISNLTKKHNIWLHVDAAMAGSAMLLEECRGLWEGIEEADSMAWNPHKWMGAILDCALFYTRQPEHLIRVMSTNPSYLMSNVDGEVTQYRDWGIPLGRRFRALKILFQLRLDGIDSIKVRLRRDLSNAKWFEAQVKAEPDWQVVAPVTLQTVCIRHIPPGLTGDALDKHTRAWANKINQSGVAFVSPSMLDNEWMVRVSVGVESTTRAHISKLWTFIKKAVVHNS